MLTLNKIMDALNLSVSSDHPSLQKEINGVSIDTRTLQKGDLFIAIQGDTDGHQYVEKAFEKGAIAAIVSDPDLLIKNATYFRVANTKEALNKIGIKARSITKDSIKTVAITGSMGKTTLKEFIKILLENFGSVVASQKSYNNHIGVPLTLAHLQDSTDFGVFEVGMNQLGEIKPLVSMIRPDVAVITAIAPAHIGFMGSVEGIATEKADIFYNLKGSAVLPFDSEYLDLFKSRVSKAVTVGVKEGADFRLVSFENGIVEAKIYGQSYTWSMNALGDHYALLSLFALAAITEMGIPLIDAIKHAEKLEPLPGRGKIEQVSFGDGFVTVIDDSYNANIQSMKAGLSVLSKMKGRKIAVLGGMRELGSETEAIHRDLETYVKALNLDHVFTVGEEMSTLSFQNAKTLDQIQDDILKVIRPHDVIFIKGSNGNKLWELLSFLALRKAS